jgi:Domain of unknown function DUF11
MQSRGLHQLKRLAAVVLVGASTVSPGTATATTQAPAAVDATEPAAVVLISATTLDRSSPTQTFTLTAVNASPTATGEAFVPASTPSTWTIVSAIPETGSFSEGVWERPPLASGESATITIEARP